MWPCSSSTNAARKGVRSSSSRRTTGGFLSHGEKPWKNNLILMGTSPGKLEIWWEISGKTLTFWKNIKIVSDIVLETNSIIPVLSRTFPIDYGWVSCRKIGYTFEIVSTGTHSIFQPNGFHWIFEEIAHQCSLTIMMRMICKGYFIHFTVIRIKHVIPHSMWMSLGDLEVHASYL